MLHIFWATLELRVSTPKCRCPPHSTIIVIFSFNTWYISSFFSVLIYGKTLWEGPMPDIHMHIADTTTGKKMDMHAVDQVIYGWMRLKSEQIPISSLEVTCAAKWHSATRQLKSDVLALLRTARECAITNTAPSGSFTSSDRSGLNCMCFAHPVTQSGHFCFTARLLYELSYPSHEKHNRPLWVTVQGLRRPTPHTFIPFTWGTQ